MIPTTLALSLALPALALAAKAPKDAILLSDVESLTLRGNGAKTAHRRVSAIPQLRCISSRPICDLYQIDVLRCTNQGSSYGDEDIEWSCAASLPEELKLGSTDVICEGYKSPDDPYILKGSCGVEYRLALTSKGERRYPNLANGGGWFSDGEGGTDWGAWVFTAIFVAVLGWIIYSACIRAQDNRQPRFPRPQRDGGGWGPGGPGWGPGNDPPPPYPGTKPSQQDGWTPGFWSGMAGGAAAGYLAGNRGGNRNDRNQDSYGSIGRGGRSSSSGSSTTNRHESTGFGSTSRR
ncbi:hypothetical protein AK830_g3064 [Neonectria ditissima]|uniref:Store-operated calcium entry-associated regulatory factor n=1 Tax=Neonectria ditissima TaxID=78410 RepID=A0A0P7BSZ7_9HYPO|nr:hypothetical protein AK830_g3064 [Neonectria ditissima]